VATRREAFPFPPSRYSETAGRSLGKVIVSEPLSPFHAALTAFEVRFESEMTSRWQDLESAAALGASAPSGERRSALYRFFEDAGKMIGSVVHEYFPKLLQVATAQRQHLGDESPLAWTEAEVLRQVCNFLGVDEKFDHTSAPRDDSRLVVAAARIALGVGWLDEGIPSDFALPGWLSSDWALRQAMRHRGPTEEDAAKSLPPLSRAETLGWIKAVELHVRKKLERQIDKDSWDGIYRSWKVGRFGSRCIRHRRWRAKRQEANRGYYGTARRQFC